MALLPFSGNGIANSFILLFPFSYSGIVVPMECCFAHTGQESAYKTSVLRIFHCIFIQRSKISFYNISIILFNAYPVIITTVFLVLKSIILALQFISLFSKNPDIFNKNIRNPAISKLSGN